MAGAAADPDPDLQRGLALLNEGRASSALEALNGYALRCRCSEGELLRGRALLELERPQSALEAFRTALQLEPSLLAARLHAVLALERLGRWEEASVELELALAGPALPDSLRGTLAERRAANGERQRLQRAGARHPPPRRLGDKVNSPADDFMPLLSADGRRLSFTSNRPGGLDPLGRAGVHREDFWTCLRTPGGEWGTARLLDPPFNTVTSEGSGTLSADGRLFVFSACGRPEGAGDCDLFLAEWTGSDWTPPRPLTDVNGPGWDSQPALAPDGTWLLFASDRPGGQGGRDLWIARRQADGGYGDPLNAGGVLNTAGHEAGPFLHADGHSLYFSSDGRVGFGGLDLFHSRLDGEGRWSPPVNLGPPFSTLEPDLGFCLSADGATTLFSSRRDGRPDLDLYESRAPSCCPPDPMIALTGKVMELGSGRPLAARLRLEGLEQASERAELRCGEDGSFTLLAGSGPHLLFADAPEHLFSCLPVILGSTPTRATGEGKAWTVAAEDTLVVWLSPLLPGAHTVLPMVRFAFDRAELQPEGLPVLEHTRDWLLSHPEAQVELRGHTDDVGGDAYNLELSLRRALAVKVWLVAAGIPETKIQTLGRGRREPLSPGTDEASRSANRRTELWLR